MMPTTPHGRRALAAGCAIALALLAAPAASARLGDLDPGFGGDGLATPDVGPIGSVGAEFADVAVRPDGRVVAAGWATNADNFEQALVAGLTGSGAPDAGFGQTAPGVTRVTSGPEAQLHAVALDPDGRALAAGHQQLTTQLPFVYAFSASGALQPGFPAQIGGTTGQATTVIALPDRSMLVGGWRGGSVTAQGFFVAKLTAGGALDPGFGAGGIADVPLGAQSRLGGLAVDGAGRIVLAGTRTIVLGGGSIDQAVLARLTPAGAPDAAFGANGLVDATPTNPGGQATGELRDVAIDGAGRIVAAGISGPYAFVTRRVDNGAPDGGFGAGGAAFGTLAQPAELGALALDADHPLVAGETAGQLLLGALDRAGAPSPAFPGPPLGWRGFPSPQPGSIAALGAAVLPGGTLYTAGSLMAPNEQRTPFVARHLGNAAPAAALSAAAGATAGAPVTFDASGSSDLEGEPLRFAFDLDGDGTYEVDAGQSPVATRSFGAPGQYTVGVRVTDPRGGSATAAQGVAVIAGAQPQPPPRPRLGLQGVAEPTRGIVRIRLPGTKRFVRLRGLSAIPNGTEIDARRGRVRLTVERNASGALDSAVFYAGRFVFRQAKGARPITTLRLSGGSFAGCRARPARASAAIASAAQTARKKKRVRRLWGDGSGRFRTRGRYGAATVRGTKWLTQDQCNGTKVRVVRGIVSVQDLVRPRRRAQLVERGEQVLIAAGRRR